MLELHPIAETGTHRCHNSSRPWPSRIRRVEWHHRNIPLHKLGAGPVHALAQRVAVCNGTTRSPNEISWEPGPAKDSGVQSVTEPKPYFQSTQTPRRTFGLSIDNRLEKSIGTRSVFCFHISHAIFTQAVEVNREALYQANLP